MFSLVGCHRFFRRAIPSPVTRGLSPGSKFIYRNHSYFLHHISAHQTDELHVIVCPHCKREHKEMLKNFYHKKCKCGKRYAVAGAALFFEDFPYRQGVCPAGSCAPDK